MRRSLFGVVLLTAALAFLLALLPLPGRAITTQADDAFAEISGCIASQKRVNVLFVVDESGSLQDTDPGSARVDAILTALDGVALLQQEAPDKDIQVAASTFADQYRSQVPWGRADGAHIAELRSFAEQTVPQLENGQYTDYRKALQGARQQLADNGSGCRVVLWFTDGGLDMGDQQGELTDQAFRAICQERGIADSLRSNRINVVALALTQGNSVSQRDKDRLQAITEGAGGDITCGSLPAPEIYAGGAYLPASDASSLARVFADAIARITGFTPTGDVICPGAECQNGILPLTVDPGITRVRVLMTATSGSPTYLVSPPGGKFVPFDALPDQFSGMKATTSSTRSSSQLDLSVAADDAYGEWRVKVQGGEAVAQSWMSPGVALELGDSSARIKAQDTNNVGIKVAPVDGAAFTAADFSKMTMTASGINGAPLDVRTSGEGEWQVVVPPLEGQDVPVRYPLTAQLDLTTRKNGIKLDPVSRKFPLQVTTAAGYPTVDSEAVTFPGITEPQTVTAPLAVTGSNLGPSKVCLETTQLAGPVGAVPITLSSADDGCATIAPGETLELAVNATPATVEDGLVGGDLRLTLVSATADDPPLTVALPAELSMSRPVDQVKRGLILWLLLLIAALLPFVIIWLLGRRLATFPGYSSNMRFFRVPVRVVQKSVDGRYRVQREGHPDNRLVTSDDVRFVPTSDATRPKELIIPTAGLRYEAHFQLLGSRRVAGVPLPTLSVTPSATAHLIHPNGFLLASSKNPYATGSGAPADLFIENCWFLVARPGAFHDEDSFEAELIMFSQEANFIETVNQRLLSGQLAGMAHVLRKQSQVPFETREAPPDDSRASAPKVSTVPSDDDWLGSTPDVPRTSPHQRPPAPDGDSAGDDWV